MPENNNIKALLIKIMVKITPVLGNFIDERQP